MGFCDWLLGCLHNITICMLIEILSYLSSLLRKTPSTRTLFPNHMTFQDHTTESSPLTFPRHSQPTTPSNLSQPFHGSKTLSIVALSTTSFPLCIPSPFAFSAASSSIRFCVIRSKFRSRTAMVTFPMAGTYIDAFSFISGGKF